MEDKKRVWAGLLLPALLCTCWYFLTKNGSIRHGTLPSPGRLLEMLDDFLTGRLSLTTYSGELFLHLGKSTSRVFAGFLLAGSLGILLGFLTGGCRHLFALLDPFLQAVRAIPGIGFLPIAIVWFGVGDKNTLFLITLAAFFPVYLNTQEGVRKIPRDYLCSAQMLGASGAVLFWNVILPAAFPQIFVGLRLSLGVAWAYLVLGEMTGVSQGIGAVMMNGRMMGNVELVMTGMLVIAVAGKLSDWVLVSLYRALYQKERGGQ